MALEHEIIELLSITQNVLVISAGTYNELGRVHPLVRDFVLPLNEKFKLASPKLNKANVALNAAMANWLVSEYPDKVEKGYSAIYALAAEIQQSLPEVERPAVAKMNDEEVIAFISEKYKPQTSSATRLLRQLRDEERKSCEQKRFGALYRRYLQMQERKKGWLFDE